MGPSRRRFCRPSGDVCCRFRCVGSGWREDRGRSVMVVQKERWRFQARRLRDQVSSRLRRFLFLWACMGGACGEGGFGTKSSGHEYLAPTPPTSSLKMSKMDNAFKQQKTAKNQDGTSENTTLIVQLDHLCEETNKLTKDIEDFLQEKITQNQERDEIYERNRTQMISRQTTPGHHSNRVPGMSQARRDLREATEGEKRLRCHLRGRWQQRVRQDMRCATCKMDKFYRGSDIGFH